MDQVTITRLRNALAQLAVEWMAEPASPSSPAEHALPFSSMTEADWREAVMLWRVHAGDLLSGVAARDCPACGCGRSRWLFESYDLHPYHECDDCGCWFVPAQVDWTVFERLFERSPEAAALARRMMQARDASEGRDADMARIGGYLDDLLPMVEKPAGASVAYLDSGCGVGHSLRAGQARGLRVQGVEVDTAALDIARREGLPVVALDGPLPDGPFQLLSFWETLEHIADPLGALQRYVPLLAEDGLVAITVPNLNALATRVMRESCPWIHGGYNTPGHVNMFHAPALARLIERAGLTLIDADGHYSANPVELFASLGGATRGAFQNLDPGQVRGAMSASAGKVLEGVWPGAALLERLALASPVLYVVACRRGQEDRFSAAVVKRRHRRQAEVSDAAEQLIRLEPDYRAISGQLQVEVDRRDALLSSVQGEIDRRDALHRATVSEMQSEINRRDELLDVARAQLARTWGARMRRIWAKVRRGLARG